MSLLGKILLILNVLAAIAFFFLAMLDYAKRQAWADLALQREVLMQGLPMDENEPDIDGRPRVYDLREAYLSSLFGSVGGNPSRTQVEEVGKIKGRLQAKLDDAQAPGGTKAQKLARILLPFATTNSERRTLLDRMLDAQNDKTDDLEASFEKLFQNAVATSSPTGGPRDLGARKREVANLLLRLTEALREFDGPPPAGEDIIASQPYKRAVAVVGLDASARALDEYVFYLQDTADQIRDEMNSARYAFADLSRQKLQVIEDWSYKCLRQKDILDAETSKATTQEEIVAARKLEVERVRKELAKMQETTRAMLAEQAVMEEELFKNRNAARDAAEENQKLERQIRALERSAAAQER